MHNMSDLFKHQIQSEGPKPRKHGRRPNSQSELGKPGENSMSENLHKIYTLEQSGATKISLRIVRECTESAPSSTVLGAISKLSKNGKKVMDF